MKHRQHRKTSATTRCSRAHRPISAFDPGAALSRAPVPRGGGSRFRRWALATLGVALVLAGCGPAPGRLPLDLSILFTGDIRGRLVPCGCFTGQYGGMTRLKTVLDSLPEGPMLRVDVGDAIGGREDYHVIEYGYLLRAFADLRYDALNVGHREAHLTAAQLRQIRESSPVPLISANLVDAATGNPLFEPYRIIQRGDYRIGIVGVLDPRGLGNDLGSGLTLLGMESVLGRLLPELSARTDCLVLLAFTDEPTLASLAREFYELDAILGGKVRQPAQELQRENRSWISFVTNESRALGLLCLRLGATGSPEATRHEMVLLHDQIPEAEAFQALASAYRDEIRTTALAVDDPETLRADQVPGVRVVAEYVGSEACEKCHASAWESWTHSGHARAFATLVQKRADADPKCIGCHTIGFGMPTGYRRAFGTQRLIDVGCESCHGPGSLHVRAQNHEAGVAFDFRPLGAGDCQKCHHGEFSRPFHWDAFWPTIQHGKEQHTASAIRPTP